MRNHLREYWAMYLVAAFGICVFAGIIFDKVLIGIAAFAVFYIICVIDGRVRRRRKRSC